MKSISFKVVMMLAIGLAAGASAVAQQISIGSETISSGGVATVVLDISGLGNGTALGAFDVDVGFNSSVVNFASATFGDPVLGDQLNLEGFGTAAGTTAGTSDAELFELSLDSPSALLASQASSFTLATLTFDGVGTGTSALSLSINSVADANGLSLPTALENGSITVTGSSTTVGAPEIDATSATTAVTLLACGLLLLRGRGARSAAK